MALKVRIGGSRHTGLVAPSHKNIHKLPRKADKFAELIKEAIPYTMEVGGFNNPEIDKYMAGVDEIIFAEKPDRQMTGNLTRMFLDMEYTGHRWLRRKNKQGLRNTEFVCNE